MFVQPDAESAKTARRQVADPLGSPFPKAAYLLDPAEADVLAPLHFLAPHRVKHHATRPCSGSPRK